MEAKWIIKGRIGYFVSFEGEHGAPVFSEHESDARKMTVGHAVYRARELNAKGISCAAIAKGQTRC